MSETPIGTNSPNARPQQLDEIAVLRQARRLAAAPAAPWLHVEVAQRMAERLSIIKLQPQRWVQWSPFLGASGAALEEVYKGSEQVWVELTPTLHERSAQAAKRGWLQRIKGAPKIDVAAPEAVADGQAQLVWANMALHASIEMPKMLAQWHAALAVDGFMMFSCFGPDSFVELRPLFARHGWGRTGPDWWDMHDIGDLLVGAGFADPVMDQERISLTWGDAETLLKDLRALGGNVAPSRFSGLRGRAWRRELLAALETLRGADGRLRLSLEIVYGHAFKPVPKLRLQPETHVSLDQMRDMVRQSRK